MQSVLVAHGLREAGPVSAARFYAKPNVPLPVGRTASLGALLTVLDRRQQEAREQVVASFAAFNAPAVRDGFRQLFKTDGTAA